MGSHFPHLTLGSVLSIILAFAAGTPAQAKECDNFSDRDRPIEDSLDALDLYTNSLISSALARANNDSDTGCDRRELYKALKAKLGRTPIGVIEEWAAKSPDIERLRDDPNATNVYDGISHLRYPLMVFGIAPTIKVNGVIMGADKLGHFMAEGYDTYTKIVEKGGSLEKAMRWGIGTEEGYFGLLVSGVKSYADLSANYNGAKFWGSLVGGSDPYFRCIKNKYTQVRSFTWKDYVSDAWDEGINCSQFSQSTGEVFIRNIEKLGMTCPVKGYEERCAAIAKLENSVWYTSPVCLYLASHQGPADSRWLYVPWRSGE